LVSLKTLKRIINPLKINPVIIKFWSKELSVILLISIGAVLGANLRYFVSGWIAERFGTHFPYGTLVINLTGSLILGFFLTIITEKFLLDPQWRIFFVIGVLGSYTTFSTYTFESVALFMAGNWLSGMFNLIGSSLLGGLATIIGVILGRVVHLP
jgi:fluoride exporter